MSTTTNIQAHIAYEMIDEHDPQVVVIEFRSHELAGSCQARELGEQLDSLIRPELPHHFIIDFANVRVLGSTVFGEIVSFAQKVRHLAVCNVRESLRLGAALTGLDTCATFVASREAAIDEARKAALRAEEDTVDYPAFRADWYDGAHDASAPSQSRALDSTKFGNAAEPASDQTDVGYAATEAAIESPKAAAGARKLTLDDFGGRSDALGG
jgi:anti-anti-sigma regulatory factor